MKTPFVYRAAGFLVLCCLLSGFVCVATACPIGIRSNDGSWSFAALPGSSQVKTVTLYNGDIDDWTFHMTTGSNEFLVDRSTIVVRAGDSATFTIAFIPSSGTSGTVTVSLTGCCEPISLSGTVTTSSTVNAVAANLSVTVGPNPAANILHVASHGASSAEIVIYDLLGKEVASAKGTSWDWYDLNIPAGSYVVRVSGRSINGEPFLISKRIIIAR